MSLGNLQPTSSPFVQPRVSVGLEPQRPATPATPGKADPRIVFLDAQENLSLFESCIGEHQPAVTVAQERQTALDYIEQSPKQQPLLILMTNCSRVELDCSAVLELVKSHLFVRVVQITQKWVESQSNQLEICLPFRNPGLPIRSFQLPEDEHKLTWEIDEFFQQAAMLKTTIGRLLRFSSLTDREMRVAQYVTRGFPNKKISNVESVSEKTIEKWRKEMYEKLEVSCAAELVSLVTVRNFFRWPSNVPFPH